VEERLPGAGPMNDHDKNILDAATERFERRLAEENGKLRVEMAGGFGALRTEMATGLGALRADTAGGLGAVRADMERGFGVLRSEMIHRNTELLKWVLGFLMVQLGAIAGLLALFR